MIRISWSWNDKSRHAPYHDFVKEYNTKNEKGWLRKAMTISKERTSNMATLEYHNLLVKLAGVRTTYQEASQIFYHAFDMDRDVVKYLNKKAKKINNQKRPSLDPLQQDKIPSSILKRKRSSQPPTTSTPARRTTRVSFSPNNSASKQISFDYPSTPSQKTHTIRKHHNQ
jgi:hypothetical protein